MEKSILDLDGWITLEGIQKRLYLLYLALNRQDDKGLDYYMQTDDIIDAVYEILKEEYLKLCSFIQECEDNKKQLQKKNTGAGQRS